MKRSYNIFQDWQINKGNFKGRFVMLMYRIASLSNKRKLFRILCLPHVLFYIFFIEWIMGIEIRYKSTIGCNCKLFHGQGTVIHYKTIIGDNCTLRHNITIGNKRVEGIEVVGTKIGNNVDIGSNSCIIGRLTIGDNCIIGAGSVVTKNFPPNCIIAGNPAKIIRQL